ncbi:MAG: YbaB/EbfC family nucleoid-associated protein [Acidimicrobiia bacterium]|nr:YbaB/EbfC family nucleoid-associated protein [Acidimicrobiia bacterium]
MTQRPPDMRQLMKQAQKMQEQLATAQAELAEREFQGSAGGGVVTAIVKGSGEVLTVNIDPSVIDPDDPEMLGDLVVAAINTALRGVSDVAAEQMGGLTGGLDLGGLLG